MTLAYTSARKAIEDGLRELSKGTLSEAEAASMLAIAAFLRKQGEFPLKLDYPAITRLLEIVMKRDLDPMQSPDEVRASFENGRPFDTVHVARGVDVTLTDEGRLAGLAVRPEALAEGRKLMSFVGVGHSSATDVAEHHDDYLVDAYLNAGKHGED